MNVDELLGQFLGEAADLLDLLDTGLLGLEREPQDRALLDEVFRAAHTLKGSSGLFDLLELTRLTHAAEDLLDAVRGGRLELTTAMIDDLLAAFDLVRGWLDGVARTSRLPEDAAREGAALGVRLRAPLGVPAGGGSQTVDLVPSPRTAGDDAAAGGPLAPAPPAPRWLLDALGRDRVEEFRKWLEHARTRCRVLRFEPAEQCFFAGDDPLNLIAQTPAIEALDVRPREEWPDLDAFDEYRCLLVFTAVTRATFRELDHVFRYVPDEVVIAEVDAAGLAALLTGDVVTDHVVTAEERSARDVLTAQLQMLRVGIPAGQEHARISSAAMIARSALTALGRSDEVGAELSGALARALEAADPRPVAELLARELGIIAPAFAAQLDVTQLDVLEETPDRLRGDTDRRGGDGDRRGGDGDRRASSPRVLKVDQVTVDRLLDLVGQLVVAKNGLPFLAVAAEQEWNARPLARRIKDQYGVVNRISEDLQAAVMDVRMLPMSAVFARFPRMVRDLSHSLGKQVTLAIEGEETAADKDVIEILGDPLVHLVRNSLDHGIESAEARAAAGKPAEALLRLVAAQEPDAVVIDIIDDGRGVDPEMIKVKAYEKGLLTEQQLAVIDDQDAVNLIFLPGFSTADRISDVSGRGVGMDAVRATVEAVGGSVRIESTPGQGSRVRLRLPLSMAISRVMIVTAGRQRFGVPVDMVIETVRVPPERVDRVERQPVIVLRNTVVPLIDLAGTLQLPGSTAEQEAVSVLIVRLDGVDVGLVVDAFHEGAEVILKPMEGVVADSRLFCGTALMGDGSVLLVLDVKEVLTVARDHV